MKCREEGAGGGGGGAPLNLFAEGRIAVLAVEAGEAVHDVELAVGAGHGHELKVLRGEAHEGVEEVVDEERLLLRLAAALQPLHSLIRPLRVVCSRQHPITCTDQHDP